MMHVLVYQDGVCRREAAPEDLACLVADAGALVWVDLEGPDEGEVRRLGETFGWEEFLVEDLVRQGQRAKFEPYGDHSLLVMHALAYEADGAGGAPALRADEVDFVVGPRYVVSSHRVPVSHIGRHRDEPAHAERALADGRDHLLWVLTDALVDGYLPVLDRMDDAVDELQDRIVADPSRDLLGRIFAMKRDGVLARKAVAPQVDAYARLTAPGLGVVAERHAWYFRDVHDHLIRVHERLDGYREAMTGALDAYLSTVSNRMNEVMKRLTVLAALFLPITFLTGLFGMNLRAQPPWRDGLFWVFVGAMLLISLVQYAYMARKGWV